MTDHRTHGHWVQSKHTIVCAMPDPPPYAITFCSNFAGLALNNEKDDCVESVRQNGRVFFSTEKSDTECNSQKSVIESLWLLS